MDNRCIIYCMVELKLKRMLLRLDFSFFAVLALYLLLDESGFGLAALAACAMHETAHFVAMTVFGVRVERLTFYGAGIRITSVAIEQAKPLHRAVILGAGCAVNFIAAAVFCQMREYAASAVNLFIGVFNLLPMGQLDGAGLLKIIAIRLCRVDKIDKVMKAAGIVSAALCACVVLLFGGGVPFTLMTTALYIIFMSCSKI